MAGIVWLLLLGFSSLPTLSGAEDFVPPQYNISLDLPPDQRWEPVLKQYDSTYLRDTLEYLLKNFIPNWIRLFASPLGEFHLTFFVTEPYASELRSISRILDISVGDVFLINLFYELTVYCTSIIAQDDQGNIYHGRNLDHDLHMILRHLTVDLHFIRNGEIAYTGTTYIGYVGLWTGQSPHKFTVSGNARGEHSGKWWENLNSAYLKSGTAVGWLIRDTLNDAKDFQSAAIKLTYTPIIAEAYLIMAGTKPNEGLAITRNRDGPALVWSLNPLLGEWFRVETNYDHWTAPPLHDDRSTTACTALNKTGQANVNLDSLFKVLSVRPVLNYRTIHTTVMSAAFPEKYATTIRNKIPKLWWRKPGAK
ncbi:N-acylethanolamine-hydrolyzing acid amidase [Pelobates fuscus]|uniref:N-acylethanolamine-hydrolyzing acid amidase n=1 Tax=Pelobates fuscus TaxID=191477 RepID=UPI002FE43232